MTAPPPEQEERWRALAAKAVGGDFERLRGAVDGLAVEPLYARRTTNPLQPWPRRGGWAVSQRVDYPETEAANALALLDLEGGADALAVVFAGSPYARGVGLPIAADLTGMLDNLLVGVELDFIALRLDAGTDTPAAAEALGALVAARRLGSAGLVVDLGWDPVGLQARLGIVPPDPLPRLLEIAATAGLTGRVMLADGRPWHDAGASAAQELAAVLATGVAHLRQLERHGLPLDEARRQVAVMLAADADLFPGIAKFRAVRRLWARIEEACGLAPMPLRLHAETSWRTMTRHDLWTNTMRATAATFAAGLGGTDTMTVLPMSLPRGPPDADARRLARNVSRVLLDEAHLGHDADPAAGSGALESLTEALCEGAWAGFQAIEGEGGIDVAMRGDFRARIIETDRARSVDIATLARGIVGTSRYANPAEVPVIAVAPRSGPMPPADSLPCRRDAEPFEVLRARSDAHLAATGLRPRVFIAVRAAARPVATWAAHFLAIAGILAADEFPWHDVAHLRDAFSASGDAVACLCVATDDPAAMIEAAAIALRGAGAGRILLCARHDRAVPSEIDDHLYEGCDAVGILADALDAAAPAQGCKNGHGRPRSGEG